MLGPVLRQVFSYTSQAMAQGSIWWWILPLAPGVPERLIVRNERASLTWFYERDHVVNHAAITPEAVDEYLGTFAGEHGVLGSMGIYRCACVSIDQTEPLMSAKMRSRSWRSAATRGSAARWDMVAQNAEADTLAGCGHLMTEERPKFVVGMF